MAGKRCDGLAAGTVSQLFRDAQTTRMMADYPRMIKMRNTGETKPINPQPADHREFRFRRRETN